MREEERGTRTEGREPRDENRGTRTEGRGTSERVGKMMRGGDARGRGARADGSTGGATVRGREERVRGCVTRGSVLRGEARWAWEARTVGIAAQIVREVLLRSEGDARENREERDERERGARATLGGAHVATTMRAWRLNGRGTGTRSSGRARRVEREPAPPRGWRVQGARARKDVKSERAGATFTRLDEAVARARVLARPGHHPPIKLRAGWRRVLPLGGA
jgi:hypothetical protein